MEATYPKPGKLGGKLIRAVIQKLKRQKITLPLDSHIHIAVSGGADSLALAQLLLKYGRRIQPELQRISLLHINHGWRGKESDADAEFVAEFARQWGVECRIFRLTPPTSAQKKTYSPEEWARRERKRIFSAYESVWTAHHADDQFETLLWRLFAGQAQTHGGGILFRVGNETRPFLPVFRNDLLGFLREENLAWREDLSNSDRRYLRNRIRLDLIPLIETIFPNAKRAVLAEAAKQTSALASEPLSILFGLQGLGLATLGKSQIQTLAKHLEKDPHWQGKIDLPKNWQLVRERSSKSSSLDFVGHSSGHIVERWSILQTLPAYPHSHRRLPYANLKVNARRAGK